ncbi:MAG: hypothetical protein S4CHLAM6_06960 [Chlamydiae bacterium]|nr:hypothetical protein [Chlamydiota bacterium]
MKRLLFLILATTFTLSTALWAKPQQKEPSFQPFTGKVIGSKVRLRLTPNLDGHIIREINRGEIFAVMKEESEYFAVAPTQDLKAYIFRTHVLENSIEGDRVNVRLAPDLEAPVITQLNSGDAIHVDQKGSKGKWLQIEIPKNVHLWIAKDYVEKVGPVEYAGKYRERIAEASQLLATANLISEAEFRKSFQEIDLNRITRNYERVLSDYNDISDVNKLAKTAIQTLQKEYCDRKINFLENKAGKAALEVKSLNAKLSNLNPPEMIESKVQSVESPFAAIINSNNQATDKMNIWKPLEYALFQSWAIDHEKTDASLQDFYQDELLGASLVEGIIDTFSKIVKNKPGDYALVNDQQTTAYLYSTHINLNEYIGKRVSLKVTERDNHSFAFPAYYVLDVKEQ